MTEDALASYQAYIDANPTMIIIERTPRIPDGAGGWRVGAPKQLNRQRVRVIGLRAPVVRRSEDGSQVTVQRAIVGPPDLDVKIGDHFSYSGSDHAVVNVSKDPPWRVYAEVEDRG